MKTGLVLEGGAHRAIYTAGVLDVFMEHGIKFDGVIGVSAGAIHGGSYVAGQQKRNITYTLKFAQNKHYMSFYSLLTTGNLVGEKFCYDDLPNKLVPFDYEAFKKAKTDFYVTCSNLETGLAEYIKCCDMAQDMPYLRASASMPFVSQISKIDGKKYLDGGITDSIPFRAFMKMGYERCVVVQTRADGYMKMPNKLSWLAKIMYHSYPKFAKAICQRHEMYNAQLKDLQQLCREGKVFAIRPSQEIKISHMEKDLDVLKEVYELGKKDALSALPKMLKFLEQKK